VECPESTVVFLSRKPVFSTVSQESMAHRPAGSTSIHKGSCHLCYRPYALRHGNRKGHQSHRPQSDRFRSTHNCIPSAAAGGRSRRTP
jgi:hypothetical protein